MKNTYDWVVYYDTRDTRFKVVTRLSVDDVLYFYTAIGRYPAEEEVDFINFYGVDRYVDLLQRCQKIPPIPSTMKSDLEKLSAAKTRFAEACKQVLYKFFKK